MLRGLGNRVDQALNSVRKGRNYGGDESGSWPTSKEHTSGYTNVESPAREASDLFTTEESEFGGATFGSDRHDTIPSPPPELDSAPWQDER